MENIKIITKYYSFYMENINTNYISISIIIQWQCLQKNDSDTFINSKVACLPNIKKKKKKNLHTVIRFDGTIFITPIIIQYTVLHTLNTM